MMNGFLAMVAVIIITACIRATLQIFTDMFENE